MRRTVARLLIFSIFFAPCAAAFAQCNARIITSSAPLTLADDDCAVGFRRAVAQRALLPAKPRNGQTLHIADLGDNFNSAPLTLVANSGQSIGGSNLESVAANINNETVTLRFFATGADTGVWSFER